MDVKPYINTFGEGSGDQRKHRRIHCAGKSDAELAATLSATTDWDDTDHADLSQIDYQKYKPFRSPKVQKTIEKWL